MTLPNNPNKMERFIHEIFHEIARDEELLDSFRDIVSIIVSKWESYKEEFLDNKEQPK